MNKFDLKAFLKQYKPADPLIELAPYLKLKKLQGFAVSTKKNRKDLIPGKTYIKYVKYSVAFSDTNYTTHIKSGSLIGGGIYEKGKFVTTDNENEWTHIRLKFKGTFEEENDEGELENVEREAIFVVSLNNNYIFYRTQITLREQLENIDVVRVGLKKK